MRWIELAGIPGSGKTTLYRQLMQQKTGDSAHLCGVEDLYARLAPATRSWKEKLGLKQWTPEEQSQRAKSRFIQQNLEAKLIFDYQLQHLEWVRFILNEIQDRSEAEQQKLFHWILRVFAYHQAAERQLAGRSFLMDEGFIQRLITLWVTPEQSPSLAQIQRYQVALPVISTVLVMTVDVDTAYQRITQRGLPLRLKDCSEPEIRQFLQNALTAQSALLDQLAQTSNCRIISIPSDQNAFELARQQLTKAASVS